LRTAAEDGCPGCGVLSGRVHQRTRQRLRDVPVAGRVEVVLVKRRFACLEPRCPRRTFVQVTEQVPLRARVTTRLRGLVLDAVVDAGRAVSAVAAEHDLGWWTVMGLVNAAAVLLADPDTVHVRRLGIDEHRYRSVRFYREPGGTWQRFEPWMSTIVDADTGRVLGVVDGRDSAGVGAWLTASSSAWRDAIEVVAIDPSAAFRRALREQLPNAAVSVDAFHLVKLGNDVSTFQVRKRSGFYPRLGVDAGGAGMVSHAGGVPLTAARPGRTGPGAVAGVGALAQAARGARPGQGRPRPRRDAGPRWVGSRRDRGCPRSCHQPRRLDRRPLADG
jgi:transposase